MSKTISLSRSITPDYLDMTVEIYSNTSDIEEIKTKINEYLSGHIESSTNLRKTREILLNTWVNIPEELNVVRNKALEIYKSVPRVERKAIHWAMLILAFPIFKDLCSIIGKLSDVQETVTLAQIKRRIFEQWGERATLLHSTDKIIKTLKDFNVLSQVKPGIYTTPKLKIEDARITSLLIYSVLKSNEKLYTNLSGVEHYPEFYPFLLNVNFEELHNVGLFKIDRIGGEIVVSL
jgi:hypothetical protein